ncbi:hypothetical protein M0R45_002174 [Rubus argutus]|uniref:Uncharacterized protein n=1 Tax=Rubus argutus TaxID=59490 RepID=A0AAW1VK91_RUBAR
MQISTRNHNLHRIHNSRTHFNSTKSKSQFNPSPFPNSQFSFNLQVQRPINQNRNPIHGDIIPLSRKKQRSGIEEKKAAAHCFHEFHGLTVAFLCNFRNPATHQFFRLHRSRPYPIDAAAARAQPRREEPRARALPHHHRLFMPSP